MGSSIFPVIYSFNLLPAQHGAITFTKILVKTSGGKGEQIYNLDFIIIFSWEIEIHPHYCAMGFSKDTLVIDVTALVEEVL